MTPETRTQLIADDILRELGKFASVIGTQFDLETGQELLLRLGNPGSVLFRLPSEADRSYSIRIQNTDPVPPINESRHFLDHYGFFDMGSKVKYGLVAEGSAGTSNKSIFCKNDGCNSAQLSITEEMPTNG